MNSDQQLTDLISKDYEHGFLSSAAKQQMPVIGTLMPWKQLLLAAGNLK